MTKREKVDIAIILIFSLILLIALIYFMFTYIYDSLIADYCSRLPISESISSPICEDYWNKYDLED